MVEQTRNRPRARADTWSKIEVEVLNNGQLISWDSRSTYVHLDRYLAIKKGTWYPDGVPHTYVRECVSPLPSI